MLNMCSLWDAHVNSFRIILHLSLFLYCAMSVCYESASFRKWIEYDIVCARIKIGSCLLPSNNIDNWIKVLILFGFLLTILWNLSYDMLRGSFSSDDNNKKWLFNNKTINGERIFYGKFLSVSQLDPILASDLTNGIEYCVLLRQNHVYLSSFYPSEFYLVPIEHMKNPMTTRQNAENFKNPMPANNVWFKGNMMKTCHYKSPFIHWIWAERRICLKVESVSWLSGAFRETFMK